MQGVPVLVSIGQSSSMNYPRFCSTMLDLGVSSPWRITLNSMKMLMESTA